MRVSLDLQSNLGTQQFHCEHYFAFGTEVVSLYILNRALEDLQYYVKNIAAKVFKINKNSFAPSASKLVRAFKFSAKDPPPLNLFMAQCCWIEVENFKCTPEVRHLLIFKVFKGKTNCTVRLKYVQCSKPKWLILLQICVFVFISKSIQIPKTYMNLNTEYILPIPLFLNNNHKLRCFFQYDYRINAILQVF